MQLLEMFDELLYADHIAKHASKASKLQKGIDRLSQDCDNYDLTINTQKTKIVHQPASGKFTMWPS